MVLFNIIVMLYRVLIEGYWDCIIFLLKLMKLKVYFNVFFKVLIYLDMLKLWVNYDDIIRMFWDNGMIGCVIDWYLGLFS